jgi:hypothetical protein
MELVDTDSQELQPQQDHPLAFPLSFWQRTLYGLFVVVVPFYNFTFVTALKPEWQTGKLQDYVALFLQSEASLLFFPLLAYAVISYILLVIDSERFASSFIVRLGIYTGAYLALQYSVIALFAMAPSPIPFIVVLAYFSPLIVKKIFQWFSAKWGMSRTGYIFLGVVLVAVIVLILSIAISKNRFSVLLEIPMLFLGVVAPFWSFLIAGQAAIWLFRNHEIKINVARGLGIFAWFASYTYALRFNILKMYEMYANLPVQPPDCYIATAAGSGHPSLVCSFEVQLQSGQVFRINRQLQRLKCAELAVAALMPHLHMLLRKVYDIIGRQLARRIQTPFRADIAYLMLKPFELLSVIILKSIFPELNDFVLKMYTGRKSS